MKIEDFSRISEEGSFHDDGMLMIVAMYCDTILFYVLYKYYIILWSKSLFSHMTVMSSTVAVFKSKKKSNLCWFWVGQCQLSHSHTGTLSNTCKYLSIRQQLFHPRTYDRFFGGSNGQDFISWLWLMYRISYLCHYTSRLII